MVYKYGMAHKSVCAVLFLWRQQHTYILQIFLYFYARIEKKNKRHEQKDGDVPPAAYLSVSPVVFMSKHLS